MSVTARRVLVIEDDSETAWQVADCLQNGGYQVDVAATVEEARHRGRASSYAVMTVDRMLPRLDGIELIRRFREDGVATPVLILSVVRSTIAYEGSARAVTITS